MYYLIISFIIASYFLSNYIIKDAKNSKKVFFIFSGLLLIFISTVRPNNVGSDLYTYLKIFHASNDVSFIDIVFDSLNIRHFGSVAIYNGNYEVGYVLLNKIIIFFSHNDIAYKLITSSLIISSYMFFFYKYSKKYLISIILLITLGFYAQSMVIIRQCLALAVVLFSFKYIVEKQFNKFIIFVLIAVLFHKSSILFFIAYPMCHIKYSKKNVINIIIAVFIFFVFFGSLIEFLVTLTYPYYIDYIVKGEGLNYSILLCATLLFGIYIMSNKNIEKDKYVMIVFTIGTIIQLFSIHFSLINRLALYFQFFILVYVPNAIFESYFNKKLYIVIFLLITIIYFQIIILDKGPNSDPIYKITYNNGILDIDNNLIGSTLI